MSTKPLLTYVFRFVAGHPQKGKRKRDGLSKRGVNHDQLTRLSASGLPLAPIFANESTGTSEAHSS